MDLKGQWQPSIELQLDQRGSRKNSRPDQGDFVFYNLRLTYLQVPIMMGYTKGAAGFELGIAPAYLIQSKEEDQFGTVIGLGRDFKAYDLGGIAGIRYAFHDRWTLASRFNQSVMAVRNHTGNSTFRLNRGQYSSSIQFSLRYHVR